MNSLKNKYFHIRDVKVKKPSTSIDIGGVIDRFAKVLNETKPIVYTQFKEIVVVAADIR